MINVPAVFNKLGKLSNNPLIKLFNEFVPLAKSSGNFVLIPVINDSKSFCPSIKTNGSPCAIIVGIEITISPIAGSKLSNKNVFVVVIKAFNEGTMFSPRAIFPNKFLTALCIDANDPDKVLAASSDVDPVILSSS